MSRARASLRFLPLILSACALVGALACGEEPKVEAAASVPTLAPAPRLDQLKRIDFNRRAAELALPLFWRADANNNSALDADELALVWGVAPSARAEWVDDKGAFTNKMLDAYKAMNATTDLGALSPEEQKRQQAVIAELAQGRPTLVENDFSAASAEDKAIVKAVLQAAELIDALYLKQRGSDALKDKLGGLDAASRALFFRNQGPRCEAPKTEKDPACSAIPDAGKVSSGLYPASIQTEGFCQVLEKRKDADKLLHQFVVVQAKEGGKNLDDPAKAELVAVPYQVAFKAEMEQVSKLLAAAAAAIADPKESAFKTYLEAASASFLSGDWQPADEAWSRMNAENSKWYLRIGPDEVYFEPCSRKAGFHVSFARINQDSVEWQKKLEPLKKDMEQALADLAGKPYAAREVTFHLPDFIDIVLNGGDSRDALGATIGQSLPNWGPVANEGRGRTVAMTNLYTDKDSEDAWKSQASSLFCRPAMDRATFDPKLAVMSTVLHEAAHNLGPAHEYKVKGKTDDQIFGGPLASTLEELKAQTSALYFAEWLVAKGAVTQQQADDAHLRDITWAFGHIAQGMVNSEGRAKPYSQLASIQMGTLYRQGALVWKADEVAANGADKGCIDVDLTKWKPAVDVLAKRVLHIKGAGDKADAEKLKAELVEAKDEWAHMRDVIQERWLRAPKASFVYSIRL